VNVLQMVDEVELDRRREDRRPILIALGAAHQDLIRAEVDVLNAKATALEQAQPRPVEQVAMSRGTPRSGLMTARTSSRVRTIGRRCGRLARRRRRAARTLSRRRGLEGSAGPASWTADGPWQ
jgi:hypothetical protein